MYKLWNRVLNLRGYAVAETAAMILGILILDFAFGDGTRFRDVAPHPLWIPVLLVASQYGSGEAVVAAALCTVALWLGNLPPQSLETDRFYYIAGILTTPLLWLGTAIIIGELAGRKRDELAKVEKELARSRTTEHSIAEACNRLLSQRDGLQRRLAGNLHTSLSAVEALIGLEEMDTQHILHTTEEILAEAIIRPQKFSIFLLEDDKLRCHTSHGWTDSDPFEKEISDTSSLFRHIVGQRATLCCVNAKQEELLGKQGLLASPLIDRSSESVLGMIKIEALPFTDLNVTTVRTLEGLCDWISRAYGNARNLERAEANSLVASKNNLFSSRYYEQQLHLMTSLGRRANFSVSELLVDLDDSEKTLPTKERARLANQLHDAVLASLRRTDQAFDSLADSTRFTILLPNTPLENVSIVEKQIADKLGFDSNKYRFSQQLVCETTADDSGGHL